MPVSLTQAKREAEATQATPDLSGERVAGAALAREIRAAMRTVPATYALSESEADAVAQMVAERVARKTARKTARAESGGQRGANVRLLRWIGVALDNADRPLTLARMDAEALTRGTARTRLAMYVQTILRDSREWRDVAESYTTRAQRQRETGPMVVALPADESGAGWLARSLAERAERETMPVAVVPVGSVGLARELAARVADSDRDREAVTVALTVALTSANLAAVAREMGVGIATAKRRSAAGMRLVRSAWLIGDVSGEVIAAGRDLARYGDDVEAEAIMRALSRGTGRLDADGWAALRAAEACQREAAKRTRGPLSDPRVTARAARRNVRAAMRTGRYGEQLPTAALAARRAPVARWTGSPTTDPQAEARASLAKRAADRAERLAREQHYRDHPTTW